MTAAFFNFFFPSAPDENCDSAIQRIATEVCNNHGYLAVHPLMKEF